MVELGSQSLELVVVVGNSGLVHFVEAVVLCVRMMEIVGG